MRAPARLRTPAHERRRWFSPFRTRMSSAGCCSTAPHSRPCSLKAAEPRTGNAIAIATSGFWWRRFELPGRTEPRWHRVCRGHHAAPGRRPRCTCGRFVPAFHRQLAHRTSTLVAVNGRRARGYGPTGGAGIRALRRLAGVETARAVPRERPQRQEPRTARPRPDRERAAWLGRPSPRSRERRLQPHLSPPGLDSLQITQIDGSAWRWRCRRAILLPMVPPARPLSSHA